MIFFKIRNNIDEELLEKKSYMLKICFCNLHLCINVLLFFYEKIDNVIDVLRFFIIKTFVLINKNFLNLLFFMFYFTNFQKIDVILKIEID